MKPRLYTPYQVRLTCKYHANHANHAKYHKNTQKHAKTRKIRLDPLFWIDVIGSTYPVHHISPHLVFVTPPSIPIPNPIQPI